MSNGSSPKRSPADVAWRVRPARATDWNAVVSLRGDLESLHARLQPQFFRVGEEAVPPPLCEGPSEVLLVAEDRDGQVRGLLRLQLYHTPQKPQLVSARRAHLEELVVARAWRRRGCGRALALAGAEWARRSGAREILLTVWEGNRAAERFYEKLGWRPVSRVLAKET